MDRRNGGCVKVAVNYYDFNKINTFPEALNTDVKELEGRNSEKNWSSLVEEWTTDVIARKRGTEKVRLMGKYGRKNRYEDVLRKVIEAFCEEQALLELAQIEDLKECEENEAQRAKEEEDYLNMSVAENEEQELAEASKLLESLKKELEEAKKELALVKEEGLQLTSSMNIIRSELVHAAEERARMKETEVVTDTMARDLNSKILSAKSKLESATAAEEKAKGIASELTHSLELRKTEAEAAKKAIEQVNEEIVAKRTEIDKMDCEIDLGEERLEAAVAELESVRVSEEEALGHLKTRMENFSRERAFAYQNRTCVAISKYEFDYLRERAAGADEVADKKVEAAMAWVEALGASKREIQMKLEMARREAWEMRVEEEQHVYSMERSLSAKRWAEDELMNWRSLSRRAEAELKNCRSLSRRVEGEPKNWRSVSVKRQVKYELKNRKSKLRKNAEADIVQPALPKESTTKLTRENGTSSPTGSSRKSSTLQMKRCPSLTRSTSFKLQKKKKKVIPNLFKLLNRAARTKLKAF